MIIIAKYSKEFKIVLPGLKSISYKSDRFGKKQILFKTFFMLFGKGICIDTVPEYIETVIEKLKNKVQNHIDDGNQVFIPSQVFSQPVSQPGTRRGKEKIKQKDLGHCYGNVAG